MSVEIRIVCSNPDNCGVGVVRPIDAPRTCEHYTECDWGRIGNGEADPRYGVEPLMLTTREWVERLLLGPYADHRYGVGSATRVGDRLFTHLDYEGTRTTWELFDAHFWDGKGPADLMIGRWPD